MAKRRKNDPPRMVFEKARETPKPKPNKAPGGSTNSVKDVLPTRDGIYKLAKKPAKPSTAKKPAPKKPKKSSPRNVQHSSPKRAERRMEKNVKRRQKGKPIKNKFNRR